MPIVHWPLIIDNGIDQCSVTNVNILAFAFPERLSFLSGFGGLVALAESPDSRLHRIAQANSIHWAKEFFCRPGLLAATGGLSRHLAGRFF